MRALTRTHPHTHTCPAPRSVPESYTLERTYILFGSMGLRHLMVVDEHNRVKVGGWVR